MYRVIVRFSVPPVVKAFGSALGSLCLAPGIASQPVPGFEPAWWLEQQLLGVREGLVICWADPRWIHPLALPCLLQLLKCCCSDPAGAGISPVLTTTDWVKLDLRCPCSGTSWPLNFCFSSPASETLLSMKFGFFSLRCSFNHKHWRCWILGKIGDGFGFVFLFALF